MRVGDCINTPVGVGYIVAAVGNNRYLVEVNGREYTFHIDDLW
jgi:hypothetical protein